MRNDGYYVTVDNNGEKSLCDVTYLKTIAKIKKAFNTQYENTYATLHIVKVENGIETIVNVKQFDPMRKTNWATTNRPTEAGWNDLASFEPAKAEVENQPAEAEVESQPVEAEVENQPAKKTPLNKQELKYCEYDVKIGVEYFNEQIENYGNITKIPPTKEPAKASKIKGRYIAIQMKVKNIYNEMIDRFYLFDVSRETNKNNIMKFTDSFVDNSIAVAYIVDEYPNKVIIRSKKEYSPDKRTYWVRKKDVLSNLFLEDFRR